MSNFPGRRGPNVSQYIANLNTIPSPQDIATQQPESFNLEDDLAMFTNTQFFDFDIVEPPEGVTTDYDAAREERARRENAAAQRHNQKGMDFMNGQYQDFSGFSNVLPNGSPAVAPIQTGPYPHSLDTTASSPTSSLVGPITGDKRKADSILDPHDRHSLEDASRHAAEEDKRRRNTAASARFRVKKKQREQALEKTAKEMTDKCSALEARIGQLEMENKWLKNLITEKNENKDEVADLWRQFSKASADARSTAERKDGVGTTTEKEN
ncbi:MAG: hypothetical protein M1819_003624 [Sarea resinae]|nr:MAG: hypothetical protein M1819_003624 [Sarea resinae]